MWSIITETFSHSLSMVVWAKQLKRQKKHVLIFVLTLKHLFFIPNKKYMVYAKRKEWKNRLSWIYEQEKKEGDEKQ